MRERHRLKGALVSPLPPRLSQPGRVGSGFKDLQQAPYRSSFLTADSSCVFPAPRRPASSLVPLGRSQRRHQPRPFSRAWSPPGSESSTGDGFALVSWLGFISS